MGLALKVAFTEFVTRNWLCESGKKLVEMEANCIADWRCHKVIQRVSPENIFFEVFYSFGVFWLFIYKSCQINTIFIRKHVSLCISIQFHIFLYT